MASKLTPTQRKAINALISQDPISISPINITKAIELTGSCRPAVSRAINTLEQLGVITRVQGFTIDPDKLQELLS